MGLNNTLFCYIQNDSCSSSAGTGRFQNWKMKAEQAKKVEFLRTAENLKTQLANLDKDKNVYLYNTKRDFRIEYSILEGLEHSLTVSRTEKAEILQQLSKIKDVKRLQHQLKYMKPTPEFIDKLKEMTEEVENAINGFKEEQINTFDGRGPSIKRWKEKQQQEKPRNLKEKKQSEKMLKEESQQHEEAQKQKAAEERKRQAAIAAKEQKAIALAMEQALTKTRRKKEKRQQKKHQSQCHMKLALEKYTLLKKEEEELEKLEKEKREEAGKEERKRIAVEEIKFQQSVRNYIPIMHVLNSPTSSDLQKLDLWILQKQAKEEEKEKEKRLANLREKVEVHVNKDWSRLYRRTKGWEERTREVTLPVSEPILHIPRR
ncbi:LOW QUALITY PROTEIN: coiled-coil domain-containing protein 112 [Ara ararauna]